MPAQGVLGFPFSPGPGRCRAGAPLPPLIRLGHGVLRVGSGSSLGCPSHTEESLTSFVPEVKYFPCKALEQAAQWSRRPWKRSKKRVDSKIPNFLPVCVCTSCWSCFLQERQAGESLQKPSVPKAGFCSGSSLALLWDEPSLPGKVSWDKGAWLWCLVWLFRLLKRGSSAEGVCFYSEIVMWWLV